MVGGRCLGPSDLPIRGLARPGSAGPGLLALDPEPDRPPPAAGALLVDTPRPIASLPQIVVADLHAAWNLLALHFGLRPVAATQRIDPSAVVDPTAILEPPVQVGPMVVVEREVRIEAGAIVEAGVVLGAGTRIGARTRIGPGVVTYPGTIVGPDSEVAANAVLGADGFGYSGDERGMVKIAHVGRTALGARVDLGALATVDRAMLGRTEVEDDVRLGALTHIAHNCRVGARTRLAPFGGSAGSSTIGADARIGLHTVIYDHVAVPAGTEVGADSMVASDLAAGIAYAGFPLMEAGRWRDALRALAEIDRFVDLLRRRAAGG
jgi:UDP-3-O-[3-hydroxymyristoyl] glucosamine N-acyltransferase